MTTQSPSDARTWNQRYEGEEYVFGTEPNAYLRENAAHWLPGSRLLCVADGEGRNSVWLAAQGMRVDAFDISEVGVAKARKLAAATGVSVAFSVSGCDTWDWPSDTYDGAAAIFVQFADPEIRERMFADIIRSLKVGGILVLLGYSPKQLDYKTGGPSQLSHLYTEEMLRASFATTEILELRAFEADLAEGMRHRGQSALMGLVSRRI
jgi:SAM-dependent methyltransferase